MQSLSVQTKNPRYGPEKSWFLWRKENQRTKRKTLKARRRTDDKLNPHEMASEYGN